MAAMVPRKSLSSNDLAAVAMQQREGPRELLGFRRWIQRSFVGGNLDDEGPDMRPTGSDGQRARRGSTMEPALADGACNDLTVDLAIARSLADKFLILCLLDDSVRPLYAGKFGQLSALKVTLAEGFLAAMRGVDCEGTALSLEAHSRLTEESLRSLSKNLRQAVLEHCDAARSATPFASPEDFALAMAESPKMPYALLPSCDRASEEARAAAGLVSKGGEDAAVTKVGGVEFAPLHVPLKRRRQMLACVICTSFIPGSFALLCGSLYFWRKTWPVLVPYLTYALVFDKSPWKGGMRPSKWVRTWWIWKRFAEYFPATLIKANPKADFSGKRPMLMGYHPHGILSFGVQLCVGSEGAGWSEKFPGLTPRPCTLNMNLTMPFLRELVGRMGCLPADAKAIHSALTPGNAVMLVVGGAAEALDTKPGEYVLTLARRNGFFRIALQHGADLVPVFGFGENDIFDIVQPSSLIRALQLKAYKILSFSMPLFYGRGVFTYNMGLLPFRRPLTVVVGDPIRTEKIEHPTQEQIDALKEKYIAALRQLHKEWSPRLEPGRDTTLMVL